LQDVITELKNESLLKGSQVGIANSYLNFRNNALHAQWEKIERESVASVLGFCEQLMLKEIAQKLMEHSKLKVLPKSPPNTACTRLVGVCAFSGSLRGLRLVPSKWRYLVPPTSG
jgi:hypothetical protein